MIHTCPMQPWYTRDSHSHSYVSTRKRLAETRVSLLQTYAAFKSGEISTHHAVWLISATKHLWQTPHKKLAYCFFYFVGNHNTTFVSYIFKVTPIFILFFYF